MGRVSLNVFEARTVATADDEHLRAGPILTVWVVATLVGPGIAWPPGSQNYLAHAIVYSASGFFP